MGRSPGSIERRTKRWGLGLSPRMGKPKTSQKQSRAVKPNAMSRVQADSLVFVPLAALLRSSRGPIIIITSIIMHGQHVDQALGDNAHTEKIFV